MTSMKEHRARFAAEQAPALIEQLGIGRRWAPRPASSKRFACFESANHVALVASEREGKGVDLALAYGLSDRGDKRLVLVLPSGWEHPTLQRAAWLRPREQPEVFAHHDGQVLNREIPTRDGARQKVEQDAPQVESPADDLRMASTPVHYGSRTELVDALVQELTEDRRLDPGHRKGERGWHYAGQRVLSITGTSDGLRVRAGIHTKASDAASIQVTVGKGAGLTARQLEGIRGAIDSAIEQRGPGRRYPPDEHWLQATIRRDPSMVGIEHPGLREVPAWRPKGGAGRQWTRGFIDLLGLDGHGDIQIVETKLARNLDPLFVLQGLDYYAWAKAFEEPLRPKLSAPKKARLRIRYVVGVDGAGQDGEVVSRFAEAQARAIDASVPWRFMTVRGWGRPPGEASKVESTLYGEGEVPPAL